MATDDRTDDQVTNEARRRLLKMAMYVPPAVLGVVSVSQAACQGASCGPNACPPDTVCGPSACPPQGGGCGPGGGGGGCGPAGG